MDNEFAMREKVMNAYFCRGENASEHELKEFREALNLYRTAIYANATGDMERGVRGEGGVYPGWVYEARNAIKHANDNTPWLADLCKVLGWQGGTVHQVMQAVSRLVEADKEKQKAMGKRCHERG